jgi:GNAT superfamily N-acetyltransferase
MPNTAATVALINRLATQDIDSQAIVKTLAHLTDAQLSGLDAALRQILHARIDETAYRAPISPRYIGRVGVLQGLGGPVEWRSYTREYETAQEAADALRDDMQRHGFRFSELSAHVADLVDGERLTADDWTTFQVAAVA